MVNGYTPYTPVYTFKNTTAYESFYVLTWPEGFPIQDCFDDRRPFHYTTQQLNSLAFYVTSKLVLNVNPFIPLFPLICFNIMNWSIYPGPPYFILKGSRSFSNKIFGWLYLDRPVNDLIM